MVGRFDAFGFLDEQFLLGYKKLVKEIYNMKLKITLVGAGSHSFGPGTIRDILLSDLISPQADLELCLMDIVAEYLPEIENYALFVAEKLDRTVKITSTSDLRKAVEGAAFVVTAIEVDRYRFWAQDFHVPRRYGFEQIFGENGGPGSLFHALRNMAPMVEIARTMEQLCPQAWLINYTNPEAKICETVSRLTKIKVVGLCHEVFGGLTRMERILGIKREHIDGRACGLNHFTWFQTLTDRRTARDLYPLLAEKEKQMYWLAEWDDIAMARILFRTFGFWPASTTNHFGEYIHWARDFLASAPLQYFFDPAEGECWDTGKIPPFVYSLTSNPTDAPLFFDKPIPQWAGAGHDEVPLEKRELKSSGEYATPIIEAIAFDQKRVLDAVVMENNGALPGVPDATAVETPATADGKGIHQSQMEPLPDAINAMIYTQAMIHKLLIEALAERSKNKLLQATLLEPTVNSYTSAAAMVNELLRLQKDILPPLE